MKLLITFCLFVSAIGAQRIDRTIAVTIDDLAAMMVRHGYKFVTLEDALKDEAYRLPDNFTRRAGISWLHRWTLDKGREFVLPDEPMVPEFVLKLSGFTSE